MERRKPFPFLVREMNALLQQLIECVDFNVWLKAPYKQVLNKIRTLPISSLIIPSLHSLLQNLVTMIMTRTNTIIKEPHLKTINLVSVLRNRVCFLSIQKQQPRVHHRINVVYHKYPRESLSQINVMSSPPIYQHHNVNKLPYLLSKSLGEIRCVSARQIKVEFKSLERLGPHSMRWDLYHVNHIDQSTNDIRTTPHDLIAGTVSSNFMDLVRVTFLQRFSLTKLNSYFYPTKSN